MCAIGNNANAARVYEAKYSGPSPTFHESDNRGAENWIRAKYERKLYFDSAVLKAILEGRPAESDAGADEPEQVSAPAAPVATPTATAPARAPAPAPVFASAPASAPAPAPAPVRATPGSLIDVSFAPAPAPASMSGQAAALFAGTAPVMRGPATTDEALMGSFAGMTSGQSTSPWGSGSVSAPTTPAMASSTPLISDAWGAAPALVPASKPKPSTGDIMALYTPPAAMPGMGAHVAPPFGAPPAAYGAPVGGLAARPGGAPSMFGGVGGVGGGGSGPIAAFGPTAAFAGNPAGAFGGGAMHTSLPTIPASGYGPAPVSYGGLAVGVKLAPGPAMPAAAGKAGGKKDVFDGLNWSA